jgi:amidase
VVATPSAYTADEATRLLASGALTAVQLADFFLERITRLNPRLNAVLAADREGAFSAAAASDERRRANMMRGPLDGVPVMIKDNIEAVGLPGTAGSRSLLNSPPRSDAPLVHNLRAAGLVILGATNLSEWANFRSTASTSGWSAVGGQTRNPYDIERNTSGSSSGSAVAVAAGLAPLTVGTETDGSIVSPAGVCGVVGFKPTIGTISGTGIVPISSRQDTAGAMARTVADAAALHGVLSGKPVRLAFTELRGMHIGMWPQAGLPDSVVQVLTIVAEILRSAGCVLVEGSATPLGPFEDAEFDALVAEFAVELPAYLSARPGNHPRTWSELLAFNRSDDVELSRFSDEIFSLAAQAQPLNSASYLAAREDADEAATRGLEGVLAGCDLALAPTNAPAWPIGYGGAERPDVSTSSLCAVTGSPTLTLPAGYVDGLPVGVSVLGRRGQDEAVLSFAAALEALLPGRVDPLVGS